MAQVTLRSYPNTRAEVQLILQYIGSNGIDSVLLIVFTTHQILRTTYHRLFGLST